MADINIRVGASISDLQKKLKQAEYSLKKSGKKLQSIGSSLTMSLSAPIAALGGTALKAAGDFEAMSNGLTAIMGDSDAAAAEMEKLKEAAKNPGLGFQQAVKGSVRLQSIGLDADLARQNMLAMGNAIALVGGGAEELDRATLAMQQIGAKGKVSAEEINQLNEVIPQIRAVMNETFGTSEGEELAKMGVDANTFIEQITLGLEKLPTATGGINNAIENAGIAMRTFLVTIGDELNETFNIQGNVEAFSAKLDEIATKFKGLDADTQKLIITIAGVVTAIGPLLYAYGAAKNLAGELISSYASLSKDLAKLAIRLGIATPAQMGLNVAMAANPALIIAVAIAALAAALAYLYKNNEDVRKAMDDLYKNVLVPLFENVLKPLGLFLFEFGKIYVSVMVEFYKMSFKVFKAVGGLVMNLIRKFVSFLERFPLIGKALKWLKERFSQAIEFIGKVIQNLPAFFAGLTAEVKNTGDKIKAFFTRLALTAQIVAKKVEKALTIDKAKRQQLSKEISDLSKEKEAAGEVGKEFGVAFREGYAAELQRQALEAVAPTKPKDEGGSDGEGDGQGDTGGFTPVDTKEADDAAKKAEEERIEAAKRQAEQLKQIQQQTIETRLQNLEDGIDKEKKIEENRFNQELEGLQSQIIEKENLTAEDVKFNEAINALIEEKRKTHLKNLADIDTKYAKAAKDEEAKTAAFKMQELEKQAALELQIANNTITDEKKLAEERKRIAVELAKAKMDLIRGEIAASGEATAEQLRQLKELQNAIDTSGASAELETLKDRMQAFGEQAESTINDSLQGLAVGLVEGIGDIAAGTGNLQTVTAGLLDTLAGMMAQLGKLAIGTGIAVTGIKEALKSLNPAVAIAGGIALLALSRVVSAKAASIGEAGQAKLPAFANGGLVTSPTLGMFGEAGPEALIPKKRLDSLLARAESGGYGEGMLTTRISGNDLEIVLDKTRRRNNRVR